MMHIALLFPFILLQFENLQHFTDFNFIIHNIHQTPGSSHIKETHSKFYIDVSEFYMFANVLEMY